ncbi:signal peptidase complex, partial [Lasius niger]
MICRAADIMRAGHNSFKTLGSPTSETRAHRITRSHGEPGKDKPLQPRRCVVTLCAVPCKPLVNHAGADLKNTSDDAIPNYLNSLKFKQSHRLVNVRLALGYSAFALAAACFLWDYKFGFESTKEYTALAVGVYMMLSAALTYWISDVEKGAVYQGTAPSGEKVCPV